jgi:hypothetical protein
LIPLIERVELLTAASTSSTTPKNALDERFLRRLGHEESSNGSAPIGFSMPPST